MLVTLDWIEKNYNKFNEMYWGNRLPNIKFEINNARKTWGYAEYHWNTRNNSVVPTRIVLSNYYDSPENVKLTTLLHEMIHIYDYTINPHHFVYNHKKVRYNVHGLWFKNECKRLAKYGWDIEKYVTEEEKAVSRLSTNAKIKEQKKQDDSLLVAIIGTNYNWLIKTNKTYINIALNTAAGVKWTTTCGTVKDINIYTFKDSKLALQKSSGHTLRGNRYDKFGLLHKLEDVYATEIHDYDSIVRKTLKKLAA